MIRALLSKDIMYEDPETGQPQVWPKGTRVRVDPDKRIVVLPNNDTMEVYPDEYMLMN